MVHIRTLTSRHAATLLLGSAGLASLTGASLALAQDPSPAPSSDASPAPSASPAPDATPAPAASPAPAESQGAPRGGADSNDVIDPATGKPNPTRPIEQGLEERKQDYVVGGPEGKTLPKGVLRAKIQTRYGQGDFGYDKDGNKTHAAEASGFGMGPVVEYGITDTLSIQVGIPFTVHNEVGIDAAEFRKTGVYKSNYEKFLNSAASLLQSKGLCPSALACRTLIDGGYALPYGTDVTLPTGETLRVNPGQRVVDVADAIVLGGARQRSGDTGLGDIEIGALYEVLGARGPVTGSPIFISLGGGFRLPTGSFKDVPTGQRPTGRGTLDFGLRTNLDYTPARGVFLAWQNMVEVMVMKGKKRRGSQLNSGALNTADTASPGALASGSDGKGNELDFERKGARNLGFIKAGFGLGALTTALRPIGISTRWTYDVDAKEYLDGVKQGDRRKQFGWQSGVSFDGLAYSIPVQFDVDYEIPLSGRNVGVATSNLTTSLKGYYKF